MKRLELPNGGLNEHIKNRKDLKEQPNYTILIDTRDRLNPQIGYVAEENIMLAENSIIHPLIKHYFETFDSNKNYYNSSLGTVKSIQMIC